MGSVMKTLIIIHVESEGPGTLGHYLETISAGVQTVRLYAGERLPEAAEAFDVIISMGGPMNVYEEEHYPFLREETAFLRQAIMAGVPTLGICLGAQLIAKACGAAVKKAPVREVGFDSVELTAAGREDALFQGLPESLPVFQWHEDTFDLPEGSSLLAASPRCPHQAFRYRNAFGLQFHIEVTRNLLWQWFGAGLEGRRMALRLSWLEPGFSRQAETLYANFFALARKPLARAS
jgi:GMP synthase (glutamine-hydrolysing)